MSQNYLMKTLQVCLYTIMSFFLFSCKRDKEESAPGQIIGKWKYTHFMNDLNNNRNMDDAIKSVPDSMGVIFEFRPDGTVAFLDSKGITGTTTWSLHDSSTRLQTGADSASFTYDLKELTSSRLSLGADMRPYYYGWLIFTRIN